MSDNQSSGERPGASEQAPAKLPARFYKAVTVAQTEDGLHVQLDRRTVKTPKKRVLSLPTVALAEAIKSEWDAQETHIDPATMPLTKLANTALDGIAGNEAPIVDAIVEYLGGDTLLYRAESPRELVALQTQTWDPVLAWATETLNLKVTPVTGIMPVEQPEASANTARELLSAASAFELVALHVITTLTGSLLLALALKTGHLSPDAVWSAAHVDEDYQISQWGEDSFARKRRNDRHGEFTAAHRLLSLLAASASSTGR